MKREEIEKISMERLYMLGGALLRYFNGMEITDEEAYIISNCQDNEIVPAIKMVQLHNSKNKNNHFAVRQNDYNTSSQQMHYVL